MNVEDAFGHLRYLAFYAAGGFVATMTQTAITLLFGAATAARVPNFGAGGAIAAVLGGFAFGALVTLALVNEGRIFPQSTSRRAALAPL